MSFRSSYSQNNSYVSCPAYWNNSYNEKYKSPIESASLYFGSAVDSAAMAMLKGNTNYIGTFKDLWFKAFSQGKATPIFDNPNIVYAYADFDEELLQPKDVEQLATWVKELKLEEHGTDGTEVYKALCKIKKNPYKRSLNETEMKYFSRASWLSMKRKGEVLVNSFKEQFLPKVKRVIDTQKYAKIEDTNTGDVLSGYIDMVLEIEGYDKPIIFDLKTAAQPYTKEQIDLTEQLTLYAAMKCGDYNTNLVGYVVLCKNIPKEEEAYCSKCNNKKDGRHQTCNAVINEARCGGAWNSKKTLRPVVQVLVEAKTQEQIEALLKDYSNIMLAMKNKIVYKNTSKCDNWFGNRCVYYNLCHKNDASGLKKG